MARLEAAIDRLDALSAKYDASQKSLSKLETRIAATETRLCDTLHSYQSLLNSALQQHGNGVFRTICVYERIRYMYAAHTSLATTSMLTWNATKVLHSAASPLLGLV